VGDGEKEEPRKEREGDNGSVKESHGVNITGAMRRWIVTKHDTGTINLRGLVCVCVCVCVTGVPCPEAPMPWSQKESRYMCVCVNESIEE